MIYPYTAIRRHPSETSPQSPSKGDSNRAPSRITW